MVTLEQLAQVTGCSKATVSKALRGDRQIAADTRRRVQRAARELNYDIRYVRRGRPSRARSVMRVGLLACAVDRSDLLHDANFIRFLEGVEREAASIQGEVLIEVVEEEIPRCVAEKRVDAVLLYGEQAARVAGSLGDLPAVLCTERVPGVRISQVLKDNREGAELATRRLLDLGHKRVVFMTHASRKRWAIERAKGYSAAMAEAGYLPVRCSSTGLADEVIDKLTQDVLEHGATAVVAGNDAIARRLIKRLERRGIGVPCDISVIGFDHAPVPDWDGPALATIDAQVERVAREAVHLLRTSGRRLNRDPIIVTIPPLLIEGQTIARCRST